MDYTLKNEDYTYAFDFKINGDYVYPDSGAYSYKIRDMSGAVLTEDTAQLQAETVILDEGLSSERYPDSASFVIPAKYNKLDDGKLFETRIVEINFTTNGKPRTIRDSYRITNFYYFEARPKDVRDYYGLNNGELPDEDIDLVNVYLQLVEKFGDVFTGCLQSSGIGNIRANRLIVLKGVVQVFPSVRLRVNQEENDGSSKFLRYLNKIDWDALLKAAQAEIEELEANLTGEETVTYTEYTPFFLGAVTDAITGEES